VQLEGANAVPNPLIYSVREESDEAAGPVQLKLHSKEGFGEPHVVRMRCPACRLTTRLETLSEGHNDLKVTLVDGTKAGLSIRHCPNETCAQLIFVAYDLEATDHDYLLYSAPAETLDFDTTDLPTSVEAALAEAAVSFSSGCYVAAAVMIRKTLEEVCHERGVTGDNLKKRIEALSKKVILPPELIEGLDSLRLLGNDAAHIESQTFNQVGRTEVQVSFDVVKELLKGVYQYSALIQRLNDLKKSQD
jgi:hypothetical protein